MYQVKFIMKLLTDPSPAVSLKKFSSLSEECGNIEIIKEIECLANTL